MALSTFLGEGECAGRGDDDWGRMEINEFFPAGGLTGKRLKVR